jgi:transposase
LEKRISRTLQEVVGMQPIFQVSDALWARTAVVLGSVDSAASSNARATLDALVYRALTGCSWDALPEQYPRATEVVACADHWRKLGLLQRLESVLVFRLGE